MWILVKLSIKIAWIDYFTQLKQQPVNNNPVNNTPLVDFQIFRKYDLLRNSQKLLRTKSFVTVRDYYLQ